MPNDERLEGGTMTTISCIIDTRSIDETTGKPDPTTGDYRPCDICGREHVIHAHLSDGRIVGTNCAKRALGIIDDAPLYWKGCADYLINHDDSSYGAASVYQLFPIPEGKLSPVRILRHKGWWKGTAAQYRDNLLKKYPEPARELVRVLWQRDGVIYSTNETGATQ